MAVVNNSGQNFTLYYNVLEYFKTIMSNHPSIAQVSVGDMFQIDDIEYPYYPLGNVLVNEATFTTNETQYQIQLTIADKIKLKSNDSSGSSNYQVVPFYGVDDVVDIHANTLAILNDLTSYTQRSQTAFLIDDDITCTPFKDQFDNGLAGWVASFTLKTHNDRNMCLFDLNPQTTQSPRYYYGTAKYNCVNGNCVFVELVDVSNTARLTENSGFYNDPTTGFIYEILTETVSGSYVHTSMSGTGSLVCNNVVCQTTTTTTAAPTTTTTSTTSTTTTTTSTTSTTTTTTAGPTTTTTTQAVQIWAFRDCGTSNLPTVYGIINSPTIVAGNIYSISGSSLDKSCQEALFTGFSYTQSGSVIGTFDAAGCNDCYNAWKIQECNNPTGSIYNVRFTNSTAVNAGDAVKLDGDKAGKCWTILAGGISIADGTYSYTALYNAPNACTQCLTS